MRSHNAKTTTSLTAILVVLLLILAACAQGAGDDAAGDAGAAGDQPEEVTIAAVFPTTGMNAQVGQLSVQGMELARDEINEGGGIEALGGAQIALDVHDAGDSVESAVSAADRALSGTRPSAGVGAWLSSFTLGVTEVSERAGVPWLTLSYADELTTRGFEYIYATSPLGSELAEQGMEAYLELAEEQGVEVETIALVGDNTAASVSVFDAMRNTVAPALDLEIVSDEIWTPPLTDGSSISEELRRSDPDLVVFNATNFADSSEVLSSNRQTGVRSAYVAAGSWLALPDYVEGLGRDAIEGIMMFSGQPLPSSDELRETFMEVSGEDFMPPDAVAGYYHVWLIKEALEAAGSADPEDVNEALKAIELGPESPAARHMVPPSVSFDETGRRVGAAPALGQWQEGIPVLVHPPESATHEVRDLIVE